MTSSAMHIIAVVCAIIAAALTGTGMYLHQPRKAVGRPGWQLTGARYLAVFFYGATVGALTLTIIA